MYEDLGLCPKCNAPLVRRSGANGPFIGCSGYPECKYSKKIMPAPVAVVVPPAKEPGADTLGRTEIRMRLREIQEKLNRLLMEV